MVFEAFHGKNMFSAKDGAFACCYKIKLKSKKISKIENPLKECIHHFFQIHKTAFRTGQKNFGNKILVHPYYCIWSKGDFDTFDGETFSKKLKNIYSSLHVTTA